MAVSFDYSLSEPAVFSMSSHGVKTTIELPHSDIDIRQLLDTFRGLALASGFMECTWEEGIIDLADEYSEGKKSVL